MLREDWTAPKSILSKLMLLAGAEIGDRVGAVIKAPALALDCGPLSGSFDSCHLTCPFFAR
jgi:hypothetical protein